MTETNYFQTAQDDARETAREFLDSIVQQLAESDEASTDLFNDYSDGDAYHHESHVDKWYSLQDSAAILSQLCDFEETDSGLWEGLEPVRAIGCQAAYTYGNAVLSMWSNLIEEVNDNEQVADSVEAYNDDDSDLSTDERIANIRAAVVSVIDAWRY